MKDFKDKQNDKTASFTKDEILEFYKEDDKATQCLKRLLGCGTSAEVDYRR